MKALLTYGKFSHGGKSEFQGLIVLGHFCKDDTEENVASMVSKINLHNKNEEPILIAPFTGLYEKSESMPFGKSKKLFDFLAPQIKNSTLLPLDYPEIHFHMVPPTGFLELLVS